MEKSAKKSLKKLFIILWMLVILMFLLSSYIYFKKWFSIPVMHKQYNNMLKEFEFNSDEDVFVFLHIQKTGGSVFNGHLVNNLRSKIPSTCRMKSLYRCKCFTKNGNIPLFSRYSTDWPCGVHPYWTDLQECLDKAMDSKEHRNRKRKYHYVTMLRNPISRYLSELAHIQSHSQQTWRKVTYLLCNGNKATLLEVPYCYHGNVWKDLDLKSFIKCESNLAHNRQTRMLADMRKVNCYNETSMSEEERNKIMLQSAKENLENLDFFGLTEFQKETQILFEHTFRMKFDRDFVQNNNTVVKLADISDSVKNLVLSRNKLDTKLYNFAKTLFFKRLDLMNSLIK